ncbi:MAG: hypothetical protein ACUVXD_11175 [Thermodesulfobacteriota bacterium]
MQGRVEREIDCPVAGRKVKIVEYQEASQPTASCCLSSRVLMSYCDEERECDREKEGRVCPMLIEPSASCPRPR